ncbi:MAG: hypothetical protein F2874_04895 [Actinobacteria bacterium]|jgi:hypothetical protein|nr:hypothetical protein [Actinomycetota bacterium]
MSNEQPATAIRPEGEAPPTYLGWAIAATALCFLPFGLVGAYYGWRSAEAANIGDGPKAERYSKVARRWIITAVVCGLLVDLVIVGALGLLGAFPTAGPQ